MLDDHASVGQPESDQDFWRQALEAFEAHRTPPRDADAQAALNRIAAKCLGLRFDPSNCRIYKENLSVDQLRQLATHHGLATPARDVEPIVVLQWGGRRFVLDGNRRVNKWVAGGDPTPRAAIVIEPRWP